MSKMHLNFVMLSDKGKIEVWKMWWRICWIWIVIPNKLQDSLILGMHSKSQNTYQENQMRFEEKEISIILRKFIRFQYYLLCNCGKRRYFQLKIRIIDKSLFCNIAFIHINYTYRLFLNVFPVEEIKTLFKSWWDSKLTWEGEASSPPELASLGAI